MPDRMGRSPPGAASAAVAGTPVVARASAGLAADRRIGQRAAVEMQGIEGTDEVVLVAGAVVAGADREAGGAGRRDRVRSLAAADDAAIDVDPDLVLAGVVATRRVVPAGADAGGGADVLAGD